MRRTDLVLEALAEVQKLREAGFRGSDHFAIQLLASYPEGGSLPDLLWADLPDDASVQDIADLLSLWSWRTDDNGARIMRAVERWIDQGENVRQIAVGLSLDAYPYIDHRVRVARLQSIAAKFPELASPCQQIIKQSREWIDRESHSGPSA
jgi:hypothetical protein